MLHVKLAITMHVCFYDKSTRSLLNTHLLLKQASACVILALILENLRYFGESLFHLHCIRPCVNAVKARRVDML